MYQGHNKQITHDLRSIANEKIGSIDNLDFYPKNSNPFKNFDTYNNNRVTSYRFDEKELDSVKTNLYSVKRFDPKRKTIDLSSKLDPIMSAQK
jgi:hypothetical protein